SLMLCCPITSQVKGYPFEVALSSNAGATGVILADQIKSVDWVARKAVKKGRVSSRVMNEVLAKGLILLR
ncbi:MAG TPA: type II toxin-antitoxin system PemK/MazF family toxin, partial [Gammaproteobacteria bacterium]|nr:type II toxin-antitoxin system PemK/MazF family toxin [Gammaproteobacteria bacterium]